VIKKIFQEKGIKRAICLLNVYDSKEAMQKIEPTYILERKKKKKEKAEKAKTEETKAEEAKESTAQG